LLQPVLSQTALLLSSHTKYLNFVSPCPTFLHQHLHANYVFHSRQNSEIFDIYHVEKAKGVIGVECECGDITRLFQAL